MIKLYDNFSYPILAPEIQKNCVALKFTYENVLCLNIIVIPMEYFGYCAILSTLKLVSSENNVVKWRNLRRKKGEIDT